MENKEKVLLDETGYSILLKSIEDLEEKRRKILAGRHEACIASTGQLADSPEREINDMDLMLVDNQLRVLYVKRSNVEVMNSDNPNFRNLNKVIVSDFILPDGDVEDLVYRIVSEPTKAPNINDEIVEVSTKSPIGLATLTKEIGDVCKYSVGEEDYTIIIKNIMELEEFYQNKASKTR